MQHILFIIRAYSCVRRITYSSTAACATANIFGLLLTKLFL